MVWAWDAGKQVVRVLVYILEKCCQVCVDGLSSNSDIEVTECQIYQDSWFVRKAVSMLALWCDEVWST